ncbi:DNA cytosine methyltransferase [Corynebacterium aquatimens]|uniref:DNA cytosine methyltransferase n=1 Tax=Corynebacterium aquatimens TaxID=1190508 RepID=UPI002541B352|nr:DNA cytosine methyltransferase [Corynebacterium aquatimens]QYH19911.1 DNA cytosine methyltransferase [Corynebacterium aquatimens]
MGRAGKFSIYHRRPPCQDFSLAGKREEDKNADLTMKFAKLVSHFSPPFFVMENVPNADRFPTYRKAIAHLQDEQFHIEKYVIDASKLGVPQKRKRLIAIGSKDKYLAKWIGLVLQSALETRSQMLPPSLDDWFGPGYFPELYYRHPRTYERRGLFSSHEPSPTIRGVNRPMPGNYKFIPADHLVIKETKGLEEVTPEVENAVRAEANRLDTNLRKQIQTFPKDFRMGAAQTDNEQMIGNAVPVMLGYFVAAVIAEVLSKLDY